MTRVYLVLKNRVNVLILVSVQIFNYIGKYRSEIIGSSGATDICRSQKYLSVTSSSSHVNVIALCVTYIYRDRKDSVKIAHWEIQGIRIFDRLGKRAKWRKMFVGGISISCVFFEHLWSLSRRPAEIVSGSQRFSGRIDCLADVWRQPRWLINRDRSVMITSNHVYCHRCFLLCAHREKCLCSGSCDSRKISPRIKTRSDCLHSDLFRSIFFSLYRERDKKKILVHKLFLHLFSLFSFRDCKAA